MMDSDQVTASFNTLFTQAKDSAESYLRNARAKVDEEFGEGYAAKHPELVAAYMQVAAADFSTSSNAKVFGAALDRIASAIEQLRPEE